MLDFLPHFWGFDFGGFDEDFSYITDYYFGYRMRCHAIEQLGAPTD